MYCVSQLYLMGFKNNLQMKIYTDNNYDRIDGINGRSQHSNNSHLVCHNIIILTTRETIQQLVINSTRIGGIGCRERRSLLSLSDQIEDNTKLTFSLSPFNQMYRFVYHPIIHQIGTGIFINVKTLLY